MVGQAIGSFVERQVAIAHPQRVSALALIGTGFSTVTPVTQELQNALRELPDPIPESFAREFQASTIHRPVPPEFFDRIVAESLKLPAPRWPVMIDRLLAHDATRRLAESEAPTLLLWGDRDALFSRADQDRFLESVPAAQITVDEDTGHCPNRERPEEVAADVAKFALVDAAA